MVQDNGYKVTAISSSRTDVDLSLENASSEEAYRSLKTGANAVVVDEDNNGLKYFTFLLEKVIYI